jgi:ferredoxin-NADP reductase
MSVREYKSQHDSIAELPLVTESATVTGVNRMDRDRGDAVRAAVERTVECASIPEARRDAAATPAEWGRLREALAAAGEADAARTVSALAERYRRPSPMLVSARFRTDDPFEYLAGQYVGLRYDDTARAYSLSSSPTADTVEICVRRVPGGRLSPRLCAELSAGDDVTLRGPYGDLVLNDPSQRDVVFLATGTGVAPFKGMVDYLFAEGLDEYRGTERDVWLFLGAAWKDDLPYREAFRERAAARENFHFVPTLSREQALTDWEGETDYVQHTLLKHVDESAVTAPVGTGVEQWLRRAPASGVDARIDPGNAEVYACGLNAMVHSLSRTARDVGVPEEHVDCEGFG